MKPISNLLRDPLTGAYSRVALESQLSQAVSRAQRYRESFSLLVVDLDHFKSINDAFGHARGDQALSEFVHRANATARTADVIARFGGDEFVLLLPYTPKTQATTFAQRLVDAVHEPFAGDPPLSVSISIGIASFPEDGQTSEALFESADRRQYQAKRAGRGRAISHDLDAAPAGLLEEPSRLIERDQALDTVYKFLDDLPEHRHGQLVIVGNAGAGGTRFLSEVRNSARLRGYATLILTGTSALKTRLYGALSEACEQWPELPSIWAGEAAFVKALEQSVAAQGALGLFVIVDDQAALDRATRDFLRGLMRASTLPQLAVVYAAPNVGERADLWLEAPLRAVARLEPLTPAGVRIWLRHSMQWEAPPDFLEWFYAATRGWPARVQRGLMYLVKQQVLSWTLSL